MVEATLSHVVINNWILFGVSCTVSCIYQKPWDSANTFCNSSRSESFLTQNMRLDMLLSNNVKQRTLKMWTNAPARTLLAAYQHVPSPFACRQLEMAGTHPPPRFLEYSHGGCLEDFFSLMFWDISYHCSKRVKRRIVKWMQSNQVLYINISGLDLRQCSHLEQKDIFYIILRGFIFHISPWKDSHPVWVNRNQQEVNIAVKSQTCWTNCT